MGGPAGDVRYGARSRGFLAGALALLLCSLLLTLSYWPGLVTYDSVRQYDQATSGAFDDWHPPVMAWLWRHFLPFARSPAPMLVLQLALYGGGFVMLMAWAWRSGRSRTSLLIGLCALLPISVALMGEVLKDCLMAGALLAAVGLFVLSRENGNRIMRIGAAALIIFAASLRFNAFLAGVPLLLALLPPSFRATWVRLGASALAAMLVLMTAMPLANRLIGAEHSDVQLSLVIFDLGGITEHSGTNAFPPLGLRDPVAINHGCYTPIKWDSYAWWVERPCPIGFERVRRHFHSAGVNPYIFWIGRIAHHPIAYVEHRLAHWAINARIHSPGADERPVQLQSAPNEWNFHVTPSSTLSLIDGAALASARTPLGLPWFWMTLALATLVLARRSSAAAIVTPLAWSALLYGLGYGVFSVASELRYYLWTMVAAAIAAAIALGERGAARAP